MMKHITIAVIAIITILAAIPTSAQPDPIPTPVEAQAETTEVLAPKQEEIKPEPVEEPDATWKDNPNNCDQGTQYIRADNLKCKDKPVATKTTPAVTPKTYTGNKQTWLKASGIPSSQWGYVDSIISGESSWNPTNVNPSSGACGLGQQLPCGKWGGDWKDPVKALKDVESYVHSRYGGWSSAVTFRNCTGNCWQPIFGKYVNKSHTWY